MKLKKMLLCPLLALALLVSVCAAEVPTNSVAENRGGSQQVVKTYTVSPSTDPKSLIEEPFDLDGYHYSYADMVKEETPVSETVSHTETVSVESKKSDLASILEMLESTMEYDDGTYSGTLALDHNSIQTKASSYATGSKTVTATKTIGPLDRNDMSYVPATTVKDGKTLSLANVEWQVLGTDLVGETLVPSAYQAVATYSGKANYSYATGYTSTAEYVGDITSNQVESVTYHLTYLGEEVVPAEAETKGGSIFSAVLSSYWPAILCALAVMGIIAGLAVALYRSRNETKELEAELDLVYGASPVVRKSPEEADEDETP